MRGKTIGQRDEKGTKPSGWERLEFGVKVLNAR